MYSSVPLSAPFDRCWCPATTVRFLGQGLLDERLKKSMLMQESGWAIIDAPYHEEG